MIFLIDGNGDETVQDMKGVWSTEVNVSQHEVCPRDGAYAFNISVTRSAASWGSVQAEHAGTNVIKLRKGTGGPCVEVGILLEAACVCARI